MNEYVELIFIQFSHLKMYEIQNKRDSLECSNQKYVEKFTFHI